MQQLNAGDRNGRVLEPREAEHRTDALLDASGEPVRSGCSGTSGIKPWRPRARHRHPSARAPRGETPRIAIKGDGPRYPLALARLGEESLGRGDVALGAEMEVHRLARARSTARYR